MLNRTNTLPILEEKYLIPIVFFLFLVGIGIHKSSLLFPITHKITDIFLLGVNSLILVSAIRGCKNRKVLYWFITVWIVTYIIEILGVRTGKIFGKYSYGEVLWIQYQDVPLVIGQNWAILILAGYSLSSKIFRSRIVIVLSTSFLILLFDIILEPIAMKLDYWQWEGSTIPIQNYVMWFFLTALASGVLALLQLRIKSNILPIYLGIQALFFLLLQIF